MVSRGIANEFDAEGGFSIFIAGSNPYLLSGEMDIRLTGHYVEFKAQILSCKEYRLLEQILGGLPKFVVIHSNPIQHCRGIVRESVTELVGEGWTFGLAQ